MVVPLSVDVPTTCMSPCGAPRANSCRYTFPSRSTSQTSHSESALTTEIPTPCRPPETL